MKLSHLFPDPGIRGLIVAYENDALERMRRLTKTQRLVMEQMLEGHPNKIIAYKLNLSQRTVENHRADIFERTGAKTLIDLLRLTILADIDARFIREDQIDRRKEH